MLTTEKKKAVKREQQHDLDEMNQRLLQQDKEADRHVAVEENLVVGSSTLPRTDSLVIEHQKMLQQQQCNNFRTGEYINDVELCIQTKQCPCDEHPRCCAPGCPIGGARTASCAHSKIVRFRRAA